MVKQKNVLGMGLLMSHVLLPKRVAEAAKVYTMGPGLVSTQVRATRRRRVCFAMHCPSPSSEICVPSARDCLLKIRSWMGLVGEVG